MPHLDDSFSSIIASPCDNYGMLGVAGLGNTPGGEADMGGDGSEYKANELNKERKKPTEFYPSRYIEGSYKCHLQMVSKLPDSLSFQIENLPKEPPWPKYYDVPPKLDITKYDFVHIHLLASKWAFLFTRDLVGYADFYLEVPNYLKRYRVEKALEDVKELVSMLGGNEPLHFNIRLAEPKILLKDKPIQFELINNSLKIEIEDVLCDEVLQSPMNYCDIIYKIIYEFSNSPDRIKRAWEIHDYYTVHKFGYDKPDRVPDLFMVSKNQVFECWQKYKIGYYLIDYHCKENKLDFPSHLRNPLDAELPYRLSGMYLELIEFVRRSPDIVNLFQKFKILKSPRPNSSAQCVIL